ncbi:hypothetical protein [Ruegeria meonggei]|uniref:hypothetical protein n=1 Tax=Ruegeria meonggei TaxID=1446476 RepID=UPI00366F03C4
MQTSVVEARADTPPGPIADLIWTVDIPLMKFLFGTKGRWHRVFAYDWSETTGIVCHKQTCLAMQGQKVAGVLVSHTLEEFDAHFVQTRKR